MIFNVELESFESFFDAIYWASLITAKYGDIYPVATAGGIITAGSLDELTQGMMVLTKCKNSKIPGLSFSWKRMLDITGVKNKIVRATGIPTTKQGRRAKLGKALEIK